MLGHTFRQRQIDLARTTLIDALRLCDEGKLDEAFVGSAMAMVFLRDVTNQERVQDLMLGILGRAVGREQEKTRDQAPVPKL